MYKFLLNNMYTAIRNTLSIEVREHQKAAGAAEAAEAAR